MNVGTPFQKLLQRNGRVRQLDGLHTATESFHFGRPRVLLGEKAISEDEAAQRLAAGQPVVAHRDLEVKYHDEVRLHRETSEKLQSTEQMDSYVKRFDDSRGPTEVYQVESKDKTGWVDPSEYQIANFYDGNTDFVITPDEIVSEAAPSRLRYENDTLVDFQYHRLTRQIPPQVAEYPSAAGYEKALFDLAKEHPESVKVVPFGQTTEGRPIWAAVVGHGSHEALLTGLTHAREWITGQVATETAKAIIAQPELHHRMTAWIVPVLNPDGYEKSRTEDPSNRTNAAGVDINRNYPAQWRLAGDSPESTHDDVGGSDKPGSPSYRGKSPLSEPETQVVAKFFDEHPNAKHWLDLHSYGQLLIMADHEEIQKQHALIDKLQQNLPDYKVLGLEDYGAATGTSVQYAKQRGVTGAVLELGTSFQPSGEKREKALREGVAAATTFLSDAAQ